MPEMKEFWKHKKLRDMTRDEWELLCDGCGRCCMLRLEDEDSGEVFNTRLACRELDIGKCRCKSYERRQDIVEDCIHLTAENISQLGWIPESCAYRRLAEGRPLAWWHPLVSGDPMSVHEAGISVRDRAISEEKVTGNRLEDFICKY